MAFSGRTGQGSPPPSASCWGCCGRRPAALGCSTAILGPTTALHRRLAYVPGEVNLWPQLTGGEVIDLLGRLRGGTNRARRDEMLQRFELDPTKKGTAYSKGNRQKVALVAALASDVELLILDEPTIGLDPLMEEVFAECIQPSVSAAGRCSEQPHPVGGGGAVRSGEHHPERPQCRDRHARRDAPRHRHDRRRDAEFRPTGARRPAGDRRCGDRREPTALPGAHGADRCAAHRARAVRDHHADLPAADAGAAVPPPLRPERCRRRAGPLTGTASTASS